LGDAESIHIAGRASVVVRHGGQTNQELGVICIATQVSDFIKSAFPMIMITLEYS